MKKKSLWMRVVSFALALVLCACLLPLTNSAQATDTDVSTELSDSDVVYDTKSALIESKGAENSKIISLLNSQELHPQKTGYAALDKLLESIVSSYDGMTTAEKVKACYAWTIQNIDYSWAGYSSKNSGYDGFNQTYPYDDYEEGLQQAYPEETIARVYYTISKKKGVCYDYAAVFCVLVRYIGIDAYVHTGQYVFEEALGYNGTDHGHHGWTEVVLDGTYYIFDTQREYRFTSDGTGTIDYKRFFGITTGDEHYYRYTEETSINAERDAGFLSVSAHREKLVSISSVSSCSGSVTGTGKYDVGTNATLTAVPNDGVNFQGWYDKKGNLLCSDTTYTFEVTGATTVYAMFEGDYFYDISSTAWYRDYAITAAENGLITGTSPYKFDASVEMTRATVVQIIANMEGVDLSGYTSSNFTDVEDGKWYTPAIAWAEENGIVAGVSSTKFAPNDSITREQCLVMIVNYLEWKGIDMDAVAWWNLSYTDKNEISDWAQEAVCKAANANLMSGYTDGTLRPQNEIIRSEGVTIFVHTLDYLAEIAAQGDDETGNDDTTVGDDTQIETPDEGDSSDDTQTETPDEGDGSDDTQTETPDESEGSESTEQAA